MKRMFVNAENLQTRIALTVDGRIEEYYIERTGTKRIVGSIFKGRIRNLEASLQAAFVDIGLDKNAFLHYWDMIPASKDLLEEDDGDSESKGKQKSGKRDSHDRRDKDSSGEQNSDRKSDGGRRRNRSQNRSDQQTAGAKGGQAPQTTEAKVAPKPIEVSAKPDADAAFSTTVKKFFTGRFFSFNATESVATVEAPSQTEQKSEPTTEQRSDRNDRDSRSKQNRNNGRDGSQNRGGKQNGGNQNRNSGRNRNKNNGNKRGGGRQRRAKPAFGVEDIPKHFSVNGEVVVQVTKGMIGDKGPRVTTNLSIPGRYLVLLPNSTHRGVSRRIDDRQERNRLRQIVKQLTLPDNMGIICRTAAEGLEEKELQDDVELIVEKWERAERLRRRRAPVCIYREPDLLERCLRDFLAESVDEIILDNRDAYDKTLSDVQRIEPNRRPKVRLHDNPTPLFDHYRLLEQIHNIFRRKIGLPSGAEICFDETEALIAVDINSGKSRGGKDHPETILNTNMEAAEEIGRQLKVRNVGGLIVIDFIDMRSRRDQQKVYRKMRQVMGRDRAKSKILPLSKLGLMQLTRQREHASLQNAVYEPCSYCEGRGLVKSSTTISVEIQRRLQEVLRRDRGKQTQIRVTVHPSVLKRLKHEDAAILDAMEAQFGGDLSFRADPAVHQEEFHLINTKTGKEL